MMQKVRNLLKIKPVLTGLVLVLASMDAQGVIQFSNDAVQSMVMSAQNNASQLKASQEYKDILQAATAQSAEVARDRSYADIKPTTSVQSVMTTLGLASPLAGNPGAAPELKAATGAIEFVSLNMPAASLRQIVADAHAYNIPVVIRGLLQNNWKLTTASITSILQPPGGNAVPGSFEIDPLWFRTFGITQVPALVVVAADPQCMPNDKTCVPAYDVVYGNIPVGKALSLIASNGTAGQATAQQYLQQGGSNAN